MGVGSRGRGSDTLREVEEVDSGRELKVRHSREPLPPHAGATPRVPTTPRARSHPELRVPPVHSTRGGARWRGLCPGVGGR